jgi:N-acetylmuramoyl-L-alanine amidase
MAGAAILTHLLPRMVLTTWAAVRRDCNSSVLRIVYGVLQVFIACCLLPIAYCQQPSTAPAFLVVIDPAHGGTDIGARIAANLPEKNLTLLLARKLREELQHRNVLVTLLRDADSDVPLEQRASKANLDRPALFISIHAEPGTALRIYVPLSPNGPQGPMDRNGFLPWHSAQAAFTAASALFARQVEQSLQKHELASQIFPAFVNPLNSIAAPAIAVEAPADRNGLKISADVLAGALAEAVAADKLHVQGGK